MPSFRIDEVITYVKFARPELDLVGVVLGAFSLAGLLVVLALLIGLTLGVRLILKRRRHAPELPTTLDLREH
jgi:hypothetical protein